VLGKGEHEGKAPEGTTSVSRGLVRSRAERLTVVNKPEGGGARKLLRKRGGGAKGRTRPRGRTAVAARLDRAGENREWRRRETRRGTDEGVRGRGLSRVREFYAGAEWDVFEVRDLREHDGV